ncbi:MAG: barstar family protein [Dermatophilaceae bacterium]|nr:barstar family protein [Intrasporangiaceae bacterium]
MIRFVDAGDMTLDDLVVDLESSGPCDIVSGGRTKKRALERFAETLRFPDWFGHNLDALYEQLDEHAYAATASGADWRLLWVPSERLVAEHPRDFARLVAVLADVADARIRSADGARGRRRIVVRGPDPAHLPAHLPDRRSPRD